MDKLADVRQPVVTLGILIGVVGGGLLVIVLLLLFCRFLASHNKADDPQPTRPLTKSEALLRRCAKMASYFWPTDEELRRTRNPYGHQPRKTVVALANTAKTAGFNLDFISKASRRFSKQLPPSTDNDNDTTRVEAGDNRKWLTVETDEDSYFKQASSSVLNITNNDEQTEIDFEKGGQARARMSESSVVNSNTAIEDDDDDNDESLMPEAPPPTCQKNVEIVCHQLVDTATQPLLNDANGEQHRHHHHQQANNFASTFIAALPSNHAEEEEENEADGQAVDATSTSINNGNQQPQQQNSNSNSNIQIAGGDYSQQQQSFSGSPLMQLRQRAWASYGQTSNSTDARPVFRITIDATTPGNHASTTAGADGTAPITAATAAVISSSNSASTIANNVNNQPAHPPPTGYSNMAPVDPTQNKTTNHLYSSAASSPSSPRIIPSNSNVAITSKKLSGGNNQLSASCDYYTIEENSWPSVSPKPPRRLPSHLHPNFASLAYSNSSLNTDRSPGNQHFADYYVNNAHQVFTPTMEASLDYHQASTPMVPNGSSGLLEQHSQPQSTTPHQNSPRTAAQRFRQQCHYLHNSFSPQMLRQALLTAPGANGHTSLPVSPQASPTVLRRGMFANSGCATYDAWVSGETNNSSPYPASIDWGDVRGYWHPQASSPYLSPPPAFASPDMMAQSPIRAMSVASSSIGTNEGEQMYLASTSNSRRLLDLRGHRSDDCIMGPPTVGGPPMMEFSYYRQARSWEEEGTIIDLSTKCRQISVGQSAQGQQQEQQPASSNQNANQSTDQSADGSRCNAPIEVCRELWKIRSTFAERSSETDDTENMEIDQDDNSKQMDAVPQQSTEETAVPPKQLLKPPAEESSKRQQAMRRLWSSSRSTVQQPPENSIDSIDTDNADLSSERGYECTATSFDSNTDAVVVPPITPADDSSAANKNSKPAVVGNAASSNNGGEEASPTPSHRSKDQQRLRKTTDSGYKSMSVEHQLHQHQGSNKGTPVLDDIMSSEASEAGQGNKSSSCEKPDAEAIPQPVATLASTTMTPAGTKTAPRKPQTLSLPSGGSIGDGAISPMQPPGSPKKLLKRQETVLASPDFHATNGVAVAATAAVVTEVKTSIDSSAPATTATALSPQPEQKRPQQQALAKLGQTQKQDSFDDPNMPYYITKPAVFVRLLRMKANRGHSQSSYLQSLLSRDYSIDEKTNKIFNDFVKFDPNLERRSSLSPTTSHRPYRPHSLRFSQALPSAKHNCVTGACQSVYQHHFSAEDMSTLGVVVPASSNNKHIEQQLPQQISHNMALASSLPAAEPMMTMSWATQGVIAEEDSNNNNNASSWMAANRPPQQQQYRRRSNDVVEQVSAASRPPRPYTRCISQPMQMPSPSSPSRTNRLSPRSSQTVQPRNIPVICLPDGAKYA